ncbi:hypothetical protein NEMIN01_2124 [Nematocida minor]|uniref:uncharacterized protein n=1 Tax=Nematocida minor TaxID=1912983 RepID=UPI002220B248|nr:uncharacterized protein NEMIN01_2124 [Nematocida minor]KAI5192636.1 hypothetical protein NEMIN01_2124 [Nematocida minor]
MDNLTDIRVKIDIEEIRKKVQDLNILSSDGRMCAWNISLLLSGLVQDHTKITVSGSASPERVGDLARMVQARIFYIIMGSYSALMEDPGNKKLFLVINSRKQIEVQENGLSQKLSANFTAWYATVKNNMKEKDLDELIKHTAHILFSGIYNNSLNPDIGTYLCSFENLVFGMLGLDQRTGRIDLEDVFSCDELYTKEKDGKLFIDYGLELFFENSQNQMFREDLKHGIISSPAYANEKFRSAPLKELSDLDKKIIRTIYKNQRDIRIKQYIEYLTIQTFLYPGNIFMNTTCYEMFFHGEGLSKLWSDCPENAQFDIFRNIDKIEDALEKNKIEELVILNKINNELEYRNSLVYKVLNAIFITSLCRYVSKSLSDFDSEEIKNKSTQRLLYEKDAIDLYQNSYSLLVSLLKIKSNELSQAARDNANANVQSYYKVIRKVVKNKTISENEKRHRKIRKTAVTIIIMLLVSLTVAAITYCAIKYYTLLTSK